jgi:hypothetical protein
MKSRVDLTFRKLGIFVSQLPNMRGEKLKNITDLTEEFLFVSFVLFHKIIHIGDLGRIRSRIATNKTFFLFSQSSFLFSPIKTAEIEAKPLERNNHKQREQQQRDWEL